MEEERAKAEGVAETIATAASSGQAESVYTQSAETMTIARAKQLFVQFRKSLEPDYASVMQLLRQTNTTSPIENSNYLHALSLADLMFCNTSRSLRMLTGSSTEALPNALYDSFAQMISRIKENRGSAKVIVVNGNSRDLTHFEQLQEEYKGTLEFAEGRAAPGARVTHFIVCDSDMVRDEDYHPDLDENSSADLVTAKVYFANKAKADLLTRFFDRIWSALKGRSL
jgi:hypothetical protein